MHYWTCSHHRICQGWLISENRLQLYLHHASPSQAQKQGAKSLLSLLTLFGSTFVPSAGCSSLEPAGKALGGCSVAPGQCSWCMVHLALLRSPKGFHTSTCSHRGSALVLSPTAEPEQCAAPQYVLQVVCCSLFQIGLVK